MPGELVKALHERRNQAISQAREIAERAYTDNRELDASEQGTFDALNEEADKLDKRIAAALDQEERSKKTDEQFNRLLGQPQDPAKRGSDGAQTATELRSFLKGEPGSPRLYEVRPTGPTPTDLRTLSRLTTGAGGSTVPTSFYDRLMAHLVEVSAILQAGATVLRTDSGETIQVPKTTGHSSAALTTEAASLSASDPAFASATLGAYKYGVLIQVSRELVDDTGVDLEGYLAMQAGRALGNAFGADAITGSGSSKPTGILQNATTGVTGPVTGVSGGFGPTSATANQGGDLLVDLFYSVIAPYRASSAAAWIVKDSTMAVIRKIKDTTGNYLFQPSLVAGTPDTMIGKPIYTDPFMPAIATSAKSVVFGDISQFFVRMVGGIRFERSDDYAFANDLVTFRALLRADSVLVDTTGAVKVYVGAAT
jgi:HK97 family phage major capsid protein